MVRQLTERTAWDDRQAPVILESSLLIFDGTEQQHLEAFGLRRLPPTVMSCVDELDESERKTHPNHIIACFSLTDISVSLL